MTLLPSGPALSTLPNAFAAACKLSRTEAELFERCRDALVRRFGNQHIWLRIAGPSINLPRVGSTDGFETAEEVASLASGETQVTILAESEIAAELRKVALPLALGLSVVLELRSVLLERQGALDDAAFQLRALRQVARLLSSVHSSEETEQLILDFMAEVFFAWWAALYRARGGDGEYRASAYRALRDRGTPNPIPQIQLDAALPPGSAVSSCEDVAIASLVPEGTELLVPIDAGAERMALMVLGPRISGKAYGRAEHELAGTLSFAAAIALKNAELVEQLHSAATTDQLTGLLNRRAVEERLQAELSRATRHQLRTTVILIDLDNFKAINDTHGHAAGDSTLVEIAGLLRQQVRSLDVVGRLGGDEFLVILPWTSSEEAMIFVQRLQRAMSERAAQLVEPAVKTLSLGIAEAPRHGRTVTSLLAAADAALYKAKRGGRNSAEVADTV